MRSIRTSTSRRRPSRSRHTIAFPSTGRRAGPGRPLRPPMPQPPKPAFDATRPLRVWIAGDSLVEVPGQAIQRAAGPETAVKVLGVESRLSTGLSRPDLYNWFVRFGEAISQSAPDRGRLLLRRRRCPRLHGRRARRAQARAARQPELERRVPTPCRRRDPGVRSRRGSRPCGSGSRSPPAAATRGASRSSMRSCGPSPERIRRRRGTSTPGTCSTARRGKYTQYLRLGGKVTLLRSADGIHFTDAAGDLIAVEVMEAFRELYDLPRP